MVYLPFLLNPPLHLTPTHRHPSHPRVKASSVPFRSVPFRSLVSKAARSSPPPPSSPVCNSDTNIAHRPRHWTYQGPSTANVPRAQIDRALSTDHRCRRHRWRGSRCFVSRATRGPGARAQLPELSKGWCFCFEGSGPKPSNGAGGHPLTEKSNPLGPGDEL